MKKVLWTLGILGVMTIGAIGLAQTVKADIPGGPIGDIGILGPGDFDGIMRCRCKDDGCYGGNALSFRPICAKSDKGPINCADYNDNCKPQ